MRKDLWKRVIAVKQIRMCRISDNDAQPRSRLDSKVTIPRGYGHAVWSLGRRDNVSKLIRPFRLEHFGFKPCAFLAEAFTLIGFGIDETDLNEIGFRPMRALGIEVPRRI